MSWSYVWPFLPRALSSSLVFVSSNIVTFAIYLPLTLDNLIPYDTIYGLGLHCNALRSSVCLLFGMTHVKSRRATKESINPLVFRHWITKDVIVCTAFHIVSKFEFLSLRRRIRADYDSSIPLLFNVRSFATL